MNFGNRTPTIVVLKEGTDASQGRGQIISNINACIAIQETLKPTLGPLGSDILIVSSNQKTTISNDGATILKLLDVVHPAAKTLVDISRAQDAEVGDGTTSVTILAGELMKEAKPFLEEGISSHIIMKGYRKAVALAIEKINELALDVSSEEQGNRELLERCARTAMSSKLIYKNADFFVKMCVDAVLSLDRDDLDDKLIGIKKIPGGAMEESLFIDGVAFKKTFSYAGFEQQPKNFKNPKILSLNVELELKAEKDNAEVRVEHVEDYQAIVDAEWQIILDKLEQIEQTGANIVLSKLPIGDLATQYFADRNIFCAGRVGADDMGRVIKAVGGSIQSTTTDIKPEHLGTCAKFEEIQIGSERYNLFKGCPQAKTCTLLLRGGAEQVIAEVERSLHDAIMIVKRALQNKFVVAGGGAIEMEISKYLRDYSKSIAGKQQLIISAFAKALEVIPRQLCENAGFDSIEILNKLRLAHSKGEKWYGVDFEAENIGDNFAKFVWEPALVKINALNSATEATNLILSVDETIKNQESQGANAGMMPPQGRGRGMPMPMQ
ncbi:similar to Saccharomyces cerevisiae YJL111W CCT7 Subunit of the cytosolic chaperonin Cct ring complex, related to Tcp1p, required for the assembly of actin and tubulins in vivo [Maudiozyma saulgeensis]|uniref:T-complex protein 1 subunit eta n=1 Tax=Maudiozyma saulgeensis TaxID=1789683 RepID=A0A1X7R0S1_9SACH|nr:similar to Saccharomyces cerevisiae YJL111W CCT7 Subunit of the cytosolic chaperonin Cct ring complex, related to Tcp1p, required for the assembly of actin and tubulins in vivo [Kazachstania saulgeensis]